jgi:hypothetical protein
MRYRAILRSTIALFPLVGVLALPACDGCSSNPQELDGDPFGWPQCDAGLVVFRDECVDPAGLAACDLIEARGGCPEGYHCEEGRGCVLGVECGDAICFPGERCSDDERCVCVGDAPCPPGEVCALVGVGEGDAGTVESQCVASTFDGDGDGAVVGDLDGDGRPDDCDDLDPAVNPSAVEVCDSRDNNCNEQTDEGFDADGDGYTTCGYSPACADPAGCPLLFPADCNDADRAINPGAVDLCQLGPGGLLLDVDCDPGNDACPAGAQCCEGVEGCVHLDYDPQHCGTCATTCPEGDYCVVGVCRSAGGEFEADPEEGEVVFDAEPGPANHPDVAWNWMRVDHWFSWSWEDDGDWFTSWWQLFFWELDYGIVWSQETPAGNGVLLFDGRHFVSSPIAPISQVSSSVESFLDPLRGMDWYGTRVVAFLEGESTIPSLAPSGGLGYGLVWTDGGGGGAQVYFAALGPYGAPTGWSQQITGGDGDHLYPRLAWSPYYYFMGSGYGLVYQREDDDDVQIYFQQIQSWWDWWSPFGVAWPVSDNEGGALNPDIAWSPFGFGVVYVGADDSNLYFALVGAFGGFVMPPQQITTESNVGAVRPSIAWNPGDGEFGIAYQATSAPADNQDIYFVRTTPFGTALAAPVRLTSHPDLQRAPDMAWAGDGYGVTWYDHQSGTDEIAFAYLDPAGAFVDGPTMLTEHAGDGSGTNPAITHASVADEVGGVTYGLAGWSGGELMGGGEFGLVWRDETTSALEPQVHFLRLRRSED